MAAIQELLGGSASIGAADSSAPRTRWAAESTPSMFAGHDVSCPYKGKGGSQSGDWQSQERQVIRAVQAVVDVASARSTPGQARAADSGSKLPDSTRSGRSWRRMVEDTPSMCAGHDISCPYNGKGRSQ
jgi:hypothetical protein